MHGSDWSLSTSLPGLSHLFGIVRDGCSVGTYAFRNRLYQLVPTFSSMELYACEREDASVSPQCIPRVGHGVDPCLELPEPHHGRLNYPSRAIVFPCGKTWLKEWQDLHRAVFGTRESS